MERKIVLALLVMTGSLAWCAAGGHAQVEPPPGRQRITPGAHYQAGPVHRMLFGSGYRKLWVTPIEVDVLDLGRFSGGLSPEKKGGGKQTTTLRFEGRDGREWKFRSIDKDPTPALPKALQHGFADSVVQDQISASHPGNAPVVDALAEAAGIPTVHRRLVVLPDDARLGEFRQEFAGMLGTLEEDARVKEPVTPGFERFGEMLEMVELWERMDQDPRERLDDRAFLRARLFDLLIGDYDRHKDQWDFGKDRQSGRWVPVPKDRDMAFVKFDGILLALVRKSQPRLVDFESDDPSILGLTWQARVLDRRNLSGLEWKDWQEVVTELQGRLTDAVIGDAARRMPDELYAIDGRKLGQRLQRRRDGLAAAARKFYDLLAREPEIHATNQADTVETVRLEDGSLDLVASSAEGPYVRRRFDPEETKEVRVFLKDGDDRAMSHGNGGSDITLRLVGGPGNDVLDDSDGGHSRFYDSEGENRIVRGEGTKVSDRPYAAPLDAGENPLRDWGSTTGLVPWARAGGGLGVVLGMELRSTGYGFRKHPYGHRHALRVGYSTGLQGWGGRYTYESLRTDNRARFEIDARISDLELIRFHGFGNETAAPEPDAFYEVAQRQYAFAPSYRLDLDPVDIHVGPIVKFATTRLGTSSLLGQLRPYGSGDFGQVGARLRFAVDRRDYPRAATRGVHITTEGSVYPRAWSVDEAFGEAHGEAAVYATAPMVLKPTLALRAGGKRVWGRHPFHEAAFLGGPETVRGLRRQRYAGDRMVFGNAELRLAFRDRPQAFIPRLGVFGLADGGRVWLVGENSSRWHHAVGGGVWLALAKPGNVVTAAVARSEGRLRVYLEGGFVF